MTGLGPAADGGMAAGIVVVGGGFAGFWAAVAARRVLAGRQTPITLISRDSVLQMRPRLYEAEPETLGVDLRPLLGVVDVALLEGEATELDPSTGTVGLRSGQVVAYERLVVATGSQMRRPPIPGAENAWSIDSQVEAAAFDRRLAEIGSRGLGPTDSSPTIAGPTIAGPTIAVVGAGFTGIELALELRDRLARHGGEALAAQARIILFDRQSVVGAELGPGPRAQIEAALVAAGVELHLGVTITALAPDHVTLADDPAISSVTSSVVYVDAVVLSTGLAAAPFAAALPGERDPLGRLIVDRSLRLPSAPQVLVAGDTAAVDTGDGHRALQSCQHALVMGRYAGENAARDLLGQPLLAYTQSRYVTCLDLGRSGAVLTEGWDRVVVKSGPEAKAVKQRINQAVIYPPAAPTTEELLALSVIG